MMLQYLKIALFLLFSFQNNFSKPINQKKNIKEQDSVLISYIDKSNNKSLSIKSRLSFVDSIYYFSIRSKNDSLKSTALKKYVKLYYKAKDWKNFHKFRKKHLGLTLALKDSLSHAKTLEYTGYFFLNQHQADSAFYYYYNSFKFFESLNDSLRAGKILINLATLQKRNHDYIGSETTSFKAIAYLKVSNDLRKISSAYNNLGLVYEQLDDLENALKYHEKAFELRKKIETTPLYRIHSLNNIGLIYTKKHQYLEAIVCYKKALTYNAVLQKNPIIKAHIIDNYTHARFKSGETNNILNRYLKALSIREEKKHLSGIIVNCIHLAEYYLEIDDISTALTYAKRAEKISEKIHNYEDYLKSIELLASLQENNENKNAHFKKYISIRDSLDLIARNHKNQFARVQFEINEKETVILNQKIEIKNKRIFITVGSIIVVFVGFCLLFFFQNKKRKQKKIEKKLVIDFDEYLTQKYKLTKENLELWENWVSDLNQDELALKLGLKINGLKSRRKSLRDKIILKREIKGNFNKSKAIIFYKEEQEFYKKNSPKSNKTDL